MREVNRRRFGETMFLFAVKRGKARVNLAHPQTGLTELRSLPLWRQIRSAQLAGSSPRPLLVCTAIRSVGGPVAQRRVWLSEHVPGHRTRTGAALT